ncbi:MAG: lipopolysaccharide biosynthesis protein [Negativicutes bacterium]|nr:lipopolysaccharide biosynthesis protein [Negativicutes bacterium]
MHTYKSFIKDNLIAVMGHVLIYIRGLLLIPLIIKTVGVTVYGGYALLVSLLGFSFGISSLGVGFRCKRFLPSAPDRQTKQALFYPQLFFQVLSILIVSLLFIFFGSTIKSLFFKNEVNFSLLLCAIYLVVYLAYSQTNDYYRYTHRIKYSTMQAVLFVYLHVAFIIVLYFFYHNINVNLLISSEVLSLALVSIPLIFFVFKDISFSFYVLEFRKILDDIKLGFPLIVSYVVDTIFIVSDRFIIAFFLSVTDVGYYSPAYALGSLISLFPKAIGTVLPQLLSKSVDGGREDEARVMFGYALKGFLLLAIPFAVGSIVLSKPLLTLFGNEDVAQNGFLIMPIIASGTIFFGLYLLFSNVLFVQMKTVVMLRMNAIAAGLNLILNVLLLYIFRNILVNAIVAFISYFVIFILIYNVVNKSWSVKFEFKIIVKYLLAALIMGIILYGMSVLLSANAYRIIYVLSEILFGIIIYFAVLIAMKTFTPKEINYFKRLFLHT